MALKNDNHDEGATADRYVSNDQKLNVGNNISTSTNTDFTSYEYINRYYRSLSMRRRYGNKNNNLYGKVPFDR